MKAGDFTPEEHDAVWHLLAVDLEMPRVLDHDVERVLGMVGSFMDERLALAWEQGYTSGSSRAMRMMSDEPNVPAATNPYKPAKETQ